MLPEKGVRTTGVTPSRLQGVLSWLAESQERCKDVPAPTPWGMRLWGVEKGTVQM